MRYLFLILLVLAKLSFALPNLSLVESVPLDTIYGQASIPHTEKVWLEMIQQAKKSIDIGAFYINSLPRSSMASIITALNAAAERGVTVRLLLDKSFMEESASSVKTLSPKIIIRYIDMHMLAGGVMHAKYMVVDGHGVFIGSQNFDWKAISQNHEIGVYIDNQRLASTIEQLFSIDWQLTSTPTKKTAWRLVDIYQGKSIVNYQHPITINDARIFPAFSPKNLNPHGFNWELSELVYLLNHAKQSVDIQVYQYSDISYSKHYKKWQRLNKALIGAATRGVNVEIIVSDVMLHNRGLDDLKKLAHVKNITIRMSHLPLYKGKTIPYARVEHAKYMIIDNKISWISTGNWSDDYFYATRDITVIIDNDAFAAQLTSVFNQDWHGPYLSTIR